MKTKRIQAAAAVVLLIVLIAACSGDGESDTSITLPEGATLPDVTAPEATTPEAAPETTAPPAKMTTASPSWPASRNSRAASIVWV